MLRAARHITVAAAPHAPKQQVCQGGSGSFRVQCEGWHTSCHFVWSDDTCFADGCGRVSLSGGECNNVSLLHDQGGLRCASCHANLTSRDQKSNLVRL